MARRGGWRPRRYVIPSEVPVWVASGRWGPRRVRVEHCATLRAELVYHEMVCDGSEFGAGARAILQWTPPGAATSWRIEAELAANAVWRRGRLFFRCACCRRRATRLYVPRADLQPRCRQCWGLSYESRSWSYKAGGFLQFLGPLGRLTTLDRRDDRRNAARKRYAERRPFLMRSTQSLA